MKTLALLLSSLFIIFNSNTLLATEMDSSEAKSQKEQFFLPETLRIFSKFMLDGVGKSDREQIRNFNEAIDVLNRWNEMEARSVSATDMKDYLQQRYLDRESYTNLNFEVEHLKRGIGLQKFRVHTQNPELVGQINKYHRSQIEFARSQLEVLSKQLLEGHSTEAAQSLKEAHWESLVENFQEVEMNPEKYKLKMKTYLAVLRSLPDEQKLRIADGFETGFQKIDQELRGIGARVASDKNKFKTKIDEVKGMGRFVQLLLDGVFKNLSLVGSKDMISGMLDYPDQRDDFDRFRLVLGYGVPQLLKLLQLVARMEGMDPKMRDIFSSLESSGKAAPLSLVKEALEEERERLSQKGIRVLHIERAFHAGTIAQMHKVELEIKEADGSKRDITAALRLIKPGMMEKIERGTQNMLLTAQLIDSDEYLRKVNWPRFAPSVQAMSNNIFDDADTKGASLRQIQGKQHYTHSVEVDLRLQHRFKLGKIQLFPKEINKLHIHYMVPSIYYYSEPDITGQRLMIMEIVKGSKLEDLRIQEPKIAKQVARGLVHKWVSEAFISSGFIHADLHFGNFMSEILSNIKTKASLLARISKTTENEVHLQVPIIDFGMGGIINKPFRKSFVSLVVAGKLNNPEAMKDILWSLAIKEETKISKIDFDKAFDEKYKNVKKDSTIKMASKDWVIWAIDKGLVLPSQFVSLSRGTGIMLLLAVRYEIAKKLSGMMKSAVKSSPALAHEAVENGLVDWKLIRSSLGKMISRPAQKIYYSCRMAFRGSAKK